MLLPTPKRTVLIQRVKKIRIKETHNALPLSSQLLCNHPKWLRINPVSMSKMVNITAIKNHRFLIQSQIAHKPLVIIREQRMQLVE